MSTFTQSQFWGFPNMFICKYRETALLVESCGLVENPALPLWERLRSLVAIVEDYAHIRWLSASWGCYWLFVHKLPA